MRSKKAKKREIFPDPVYKSRVVTRTINSLMLDGKKSTARTILYSALEKLSDDKKEAVTIFENAVKTLMPKQEVRSRRVGGATYQVPMPVRHNRSEALAIRWLIEAARKKKGKPIDQILFEELINIGQEQGEALKKRDDTHKMAEANRAFAHFRF